MKKLYLIFLLFFLNFICYSQFDIRIVDTTTNNNIPFTVIKVSNSTGFYTDKNGRFNSKLIPENTNSIEIISLGYFPKRYYLKNNKINDTIFLTPKPEILSEIIVNLAEPKTKEIGFLDESNNFRWHIDKETELAIFIKPKKRIPTHHIQSISIPISKERLIKIDGEYKMINEDFNSVFRIHFKKNNNGLPGNAIIYKSKLVYCDQNTKDIIEVDVSDDKVQIPMDGIFICIEMIGEYDNNGVLINKKSNLPNFKLTKKTSRHLTSNQYFKSVYTDGWEDFDFKKVKSNKEYKLALGIKLFLYED